MAYGHAKRSSSTVSQHLTPLSAGGRRLTNILHSFCAARGQAIFLTLPTLWAWEWGNKQAPSLWWPRDSDPWSPGFIFLCCVLFVLMSRNKMFSFFSLSLLFGISVLQIFRHSLWRCQMVSRWLGLLSTLHLPFPCYHSRIGCIHHPWRSRYKNQPTRFHLYPLGSNHHNLISFLLHPAHFPHTFICVQMLKYTYRPAFAFFIHMFPTFSN